MRPGPLNTTWLLDPTDQPLDPGQHDLIEHCAATEFWLPNGTIVRICAA